MKKSNMENIIVMDFGGQYSQLIARRVRELRVFSELVPYDFPLETIKAKNPKGIIFSGSPYSINNNEKKYIVDRELFNLGIPILGICYGMQLIAFMLNGEVTSIGTNEYGKTKINLDASSSLFDGLQFVKIYHSGALIKVHKTVGPGKRSTDFDDYPEELTPYTLRNPKYQISQGYTKSEVIGAFIEEMLTGPYPWHRLRSVQKILRLSDKYTAERMSTALKKAKHYEIYDMRRIENILKNNVENTRDEKEIMLGSGVQLRFIREGSSFNHYKN